jgi:hypothetical protein
VLYVEDNDPLGADIARQYIDVPIEKSADGPWLVVCSRGSGLRRSEPWFDSFPFSFSL